MLPRPMHIAPAVTLRPPKARAVEVACAPDARTDVAGIGSALLGMLADQTGIQQVFALVSFLPLIGLLAGLLPEVEVSRER